MARIKIPQIKLELHGTVIARFTVPGRAVAWQTHGRPHPELRKWQRTVAKAALIGFHHGQRPYRGSVELEISIYVMRSRNGKFPDLTNCQKAIEDAMQGVVFVNDNQVRKVTCGLFPQDILPQEQDVEVEVFSWGGHQS